MAAADVEAAARLAGRLVQMHWELDPLRYLHLPNAAAGYQRYFGSEIRRKEVVLVVAEELSTGTIVGYAYGRMEPRSYNELLDECGKLHDVFVDESARGHGVGEALVLEAVRRLKEAGAPRVLLLTAVQNEAAQRMFARLGFRTTMLEMTRESDPDER
jgi:ribosomal protein S18 acetylase RimI-like enzyme